eukprot:2989170-Prymnesium_polylepis.1
MEYGVSRLTDPSTGVCDTRSAAHESCCGIHEWDVCNSADVPVRRERAFAHLDPTAERHGKSPGLLGRFGRYGLRDCVTRSAAYKLCGMHEWAVCDSADVPMRRERALTHSNIDGGKGTTRLRVSVVSASYFKEAVEATITDLKTRVRQLLLYVDQSSAWINLRQLD